MSSIAKRKTWLRTTVNSLLSSVLLLAGSNFPAYAERPGRSVFVHLFEWKWKDIALECERFLGPKGFAAVQVSPPSEHAKITTAGNPRPWWESYQPVSYKLESRRGTRAEFEDMVRRCNNAGVAIYADAVINHMTGWVPPGEIRQGIAGTKYGHYWYDGTYEYKHFHHFGNSDNCVINNYNDANNVRNCELAGKASDPHGLVDLDTANPEVQQKIANYMNDLLNVGVKGFRLDAAKHMPPGDIAAIIAKLNKSPSEYYLFQEVIDKDNSRPPGEQEAVQAADYFGNGDVLEFMYGLKIQEVFRDGGQLRWLKTFGESWNLVPREQAVVFIDNHDNQRGHGGGGVLTHEWGNIYAIANVFMLAWPYGYPNIMSSYAMRRADGSLDDNRGPPSDGDNTKDVWVQAGNDYRNTCFDRDDDWMCEHRWRQIANMVDFRNYTMGAWTVDNWWESNTKNQIAFSRGNKGFVAINRDGNSRLQEWLQTGMPAGKYCDVIHGDFDGNAKTCSGPVIEVFADGKAQFDVGPIDAAAIHVGAGVFPKPPKRTVVYMYGQTLPGQDMFIRGGIDHDYAKDKLGLNCTASNRQCAIPIRYLNLHNNTTKPWKVNDNYLDWYGSETGQGGGAQGSALDWTTKLWPASYGPKKTYPIDGYGEDPENSWGEHYWKFEVEMDCSKTVNGWFELKSFISNGPGWENDLTQPGAPYKSANHFAKCGQLNVFRRGEANPVAIELLP